MKTLLHSPIRRDILALLPTELAQLLNQRLKHSNVRDYANAMIVIQNHGEATTAVVALPHFKNKGAIFALSDKGDGIVYPLTATFKSLLTATNAWDVAISDCGLVAISVADADNGGIRTNGQVSLFERQDMSYYRTQQLLDDTSEESLDGVTAFGTNVFWSGDDLLVGVRSSNAAKDPRRRFHELCVPSKLIKFQSSNAGVYTLS